MGNYDGMLWRLGPGEYVEAKDYDALPDEQKHRALPEHDRFFFTPGEYDSCVERNDLSQLYNELRRWRRLGPSVQLPAQVQARMKAIETRIGALRARLGLRPQARHIKVQNSIGFKSSSLSSSSSS